MEAIIETLVTNWVNLTKIWYHIKYRLKSFDISNIKLFNTTGYIKTNKMVGQALRKLMVWGKHPKMQLDNNVVTNEFDDGQQLGLALERTTFFRSSKSNRYWC